jgi:hypothetical protein
VSTGAYSGAHLRLHRSATGRAPAIRPPEVDEIRSRRLVERRLSIEFIALMAATLVVTVWLVIAHVCPIVQRNLPWSTDATTLAVVDRIIRAESNGNAYAKNPRSSATGPGQFIDQTWLETIRTHRRDLVVGRTDAELLEMRSNTILVREMVARTVERNTMTFKKRGLPATVGTLYLAHFAGSAGAVALLTVADDVDAASVMAKADSTGKSTREKLVKANPFLDKLTVGDLKSWADRKMRS